MEISIDQLLPFVPRQMRIVFVIQPNLSAR